MVSGRQTRNAPGRKTDMQDGAVGCDAAHARPAARGLRAAGRTFGACRTTCGWAATTSTWRRACVQLMQKALERMNIKLHDAISSLAGAAAWRSCGPSSPANATPLALLALCDIQIRRAKAERVKEALSGTWSDEHIFALEQALQSWDHYQGA